MQRAFIIMLLFAFTTISAYSQKRVSGFIVDEDKSPISYANVVLLSSVDSTYIAGVMSNLEGNFTIDYNHKGDVILRITSLGYSDYSQEIQSPDIDMNVITLKTSTMEIDEVVVKGSRPRFYNKAGKLITTVAGSSLEKIGTAKDVLKSVPGVISVNDKLEVFGKGSPAIYIDNKKVRNLNELQILGSENILNVELITNPGADYDAETRSVLNIITNRKNSDGLAVFVDAEYSYNKYHSHNEAISLNYNKGKLTLYGSYYYAKNNGAIKYDVEQYQYEDVLYREEASSKYEYADNDHSYSAGLSYDFNEKYSIGAQFTGFNIVSDTKTNPNEDWIKMYINDKLITSNQNTLLENSEEIYYDANLYFSASPTDKLDIQFDASYVYSKPYSNQVITEESLIDNNELKINLSSNNLNKVYAAKGDFIYKLSDIHSIKFGGEYSYVDIRGDLLSDDSDRISNNNFTNIEAKYATYLIYRFSQKKIKGEVGLRYEYADATIEEDGASISSENFSNLLPSLSLSMPVSKGEIFLNFTSRLQRPSFSQLNNNVNYNNIYHQEKGNPYLISQKTYDTEIGYTFSNFNARANYQYITDYIYSTATPSELVGGSSVWYSVNAPKYSQVGAVVNYAPKIKWWSPTVTVGAYKPFFTLEYRGDELDYNQPYGIFSLRNDIELPAGVLLVADIRWYTEGNRGGIYYNDASGSFDVMLQKELFSDQLTIQLQGVDLFNWSKTGDLKLVNYIESYRTVNPYGRTLSIGLSWNFNSKKSRYYNGNNAAQGEVNRF